MTDVTIRHRDGGTVTVKDVSPRKAIKLMCTECMGLGQDPGVHEAVQNCTAKLCPLHQFRGAWLPSGSAA